MSEISIFSFWTLLSSFATLSSSAFLSAINFSFSAIVLFFASICSSRVAPVPSASVMSAVSLSIVSLLCSRVALRTLISPSLRSASSSYPEAPSLLCSIAKLIEVTFSATSSSSFSIAARSFSETSYEALTASILCSCSLNSTVNLLILLSQTPISRVFFSSLYSRNFCAFSLCFLRGPTRLSSSPKISRSLTRFSCAWSSLRSASFLL